MASLVDLFCPNVHDAPVTAAAYDPWSGVLATADRQGVVAVMRAGETTPGLIFQPGIAVSGSLGLSRKGRLLAWGDDNGSVGVYRVEDGSPVFEELRDEVSGRARAMRGVAVSPNGDRLASISVDGLLRIWNLENNKKVAWQGFGGRSIHFDARGTRVLCLDATGQPRVVDLGSNQGLPMDRLQMPAERVCFTMDGTQVIATGPGGISLLRVSDGHLVGTHAARGGSGILAALLSPDGKQVAAVSARSIHFFNASDLTPLPDLSKRHSAAEPTGAAWWGGTGVLVAGEDGQLHGAGRSGPGPVTTVGGFGDYRLVGHRDRVALWVGNRREREIACAGNPAEVHVDRDGNYLVVEPEEGPLQVFDVKTGSKLYEGGGETVHAREVAVGGGVVAAQLQSGGVLWVDVGRNKAFRLDWPAVMALSHGGTWLGVVTPRGAVRVLSPVTGQQVVPEPQLTGQAGAKLVAFISRRPDLLVLDGEGVLTHFDLSQSVRDGKPAVGRDVIQLHGTVDRLWGITGGQYAALRFPEGASCSILFVDLSASVVATEVTGLHPAAWVDAEYGLILEPARGSGVLERERDGTERRVLRALSDGEWVAFSERGVLDASESFGQALG